MKKVMICGAGLGGINAVKALARDADVQITVIDKKNYHAFQPLLYQVATGGLDPSDIAPPIRSIVYKYPNVSVLQEEVRSVDLARKELCTDGGVFAYDYLILACGVQYMYFGHDEWERDAPGLKNVEQAIELRNRILEAFEQAERDRNIQRQRHFMNIVIVGGGPTGVELAGALGEMVHFTLARDFRNIDPGKANIYLLEAGDRILPTFSEPLAARAVQDLNGLGVKVLTKCPVTAVTGDSVTAGGETIPTRTVIWAAGVKAVDLEIEPAIERDGRGRIKVGPDLSIPGHPDVFVVGDQGHCLDQHGRPIPGVATAALQQGTFVGRTIRRDLRGEARRDFIYFDKGQMAMIGRSRAIIESGRLKMAGWLAWVTWVVIHVWYLTGFANRLLVMIQWAWAYFFYRKGARLILNRDWMFYGPRARARGQRQPLPNKNN